MRGTPINLSPIKRSVARCHEVMNVWRYEEWAGYLRMLRATGKVPERVQSRVHTTDPTGPVPEPFHCDHIARWSARSGPGCVPEPFRSQSCGVNTASCHFPERNRPVAFPTALGNATARLRSPQLWDRNGSGTQPGARVHTCSTASGRSGTSRPPRDVIAMEQFRNGSGWLCGVNARLDQFRNRSSCP